MSASSGVVIGNLAYLIGAVVLAIAGGVFVWTRHRKPRSIAANVASFHRGLRALAPDGSSTIARPISRVDPPQHPGPGPRGTAGSGHKHAAGEEAAGNQQG